MGSTLRIPGLVVLLLLFAVPASAQLVISEFRVRGPNGANDEFVEIMNNSGASHTVAGGGTGYALAASNGVARCVIPNGTVLPPRGRYLCVNSVGYSLAAYPAGNGTTATGDATYTTDIPDNAGIALFNTSIAANFNLANRLDAVGSTSEANTLYKEGTGYPALVPFSIDHAFVRDQCGKAGSITTFGACPSGGAVLDSNNNAADFIFVDTNGTSAGAGQRLGAPGPQNLSSPLVGTASMPAGPLDPCVGVTSPPNTVRDFTSDPPNNSTFGTLDLRASYTNNTGAAVTRLRFRVIDLTTFPAPSGVADLRPRTSSDVVVTVDRAPCGSGTSNITVQGTTLEQPPSQPNGGGFNSSYSLNDISLATPLANGAAVDVRFLLGIQQDGLYKIGLVVETLPDGVSTVHEFAGCTDTCPADLAITKTDGVATATPGGSVTYTITASNAGPSVAFGATVADTFPAVLTCTWTCVGAGGASCTAAGSGNINNSVNLPSGGSVTYTASCSIAPGATGTLSNTATVSAPAGVADPNPANNSATDSDTLTPQANLAITKTDGVTTATPGGSVTYTITASNAGPSNATGATVADTFPASLTLCTWTCVGAGGGTCTAAGSGNINSSVNLPAGGSVTYTASCTIAPSATGSLVNTVTVSAPAGVTDPNPANNSATDIDTLAGVPDLTLSKSHVGNFTQGQVGAPFTLTVTNVGNAPTAAPVTVSDTLPMGLTPTAASGAGWVCAIAAQTVTCGRSNALSQGASYPPITLTVNVASSAPPSLTNTAAVSGGGDANPANNAASDVVTIVGVSLVDLGITKTDGRTTYTPGAAITYTIVVTNAGPAPATGFSVADNVPSAVTGVTVSCAVTGTGNCGTNGSSGNSIAFTGATLSPGAPNALTLTVSGTVSASATGTLVNTATVAAGAGSSDPNPGNNSATDSDTRSSGTISQVASFFAYDPAFTGGISVAAGDVTGDGVADIITAPRAGGGPHIRVFSVAGGVVTEVASFFAYDPALTGGVFVAAGDVTGDGVAEIITGAGSGGGPHVRAFSMAGGVLTEVASFFAYDPAFTGGVSVAAGDVTGDGVAEVITGAGQGGGPHIRAFSVTGGLVTAVSSFFAYDPAFTGGVLVAAGDMTGDGVAEIITGAGAGGGPHVRAFNLAGSLTGVASFFPYDPAFTGGVRVAAADITGDGVAEIITGAGAGGGPHVRAVTMSGGNATEVLGFFAFDPGFLGGVFVACEDVTGDGVAEIIIGAGPGGGPHVRVLDVSGVSVK